MYKFWLYILIIIHFVNSWTLYIDEDDLSCVIKEIASIPSQYYYSLGRSLKLKVSDLRNICDEYPTDALAERVLEDVLLLWLNKEYNVDRFGLPTWRMLVEAVDDKNHELAKEIALKYPAATGWMHAWLLLVSS